jgi:hypothetical protein
MISRNFIITINTRQNLSFERNFRMKPVALSKAENVIQTFAVFCGLKPDHRKNSFKQSHFQMDEKAILFTKNIMTITLEKR